jgi:hypothetical protein
MRLVAREASSFPDADNNQGQAALSLAIILLALLSLGAILLFACAVCNAFTSPEVFVRRPTLLKAISITVPTLAAQMAGIFLLGPHFVGENRPVNGDIHLFLIVLLTGFVSETIVLKTSLPTTFRRALILALLHTLLGGLLTCGGFYGVVIEFFWHGRMPGLS